MAGVTLSDIMPFVFTPVQHDGLAAEHVIGERREPTSMGRPSFHTNNADSAIIGDT